MTDYKRAKKGFSIQRANKKVLKRYKWCRIEQGVEPPSTKRLHVREIVELLGIGDSVVTNSPPGADAVRTFIRRIYGNQSCISRQEPNGSYRIWRTK
jgi:hypothetical protein